MSPQNVACFFCSSCRRGWSQLLLQPALTKARGLIMLFSASSVLSLKNPEWAAMLLLLLGFFKPRLKPRLHTFACWVPAQVPLLRPDCAACPAVHGFFRQNTGVGCALPLGNPSRPRMELVSLSPSLGRFLPPRHPRSPL